MFSALRKDTAIFIFDKSEEPVIKIGYVQNVTPPRYDPQAGFGNAIIDLAVKIDNEVKTFVGLPSNGNFHKFGDYAISETKDALMPEVEATFQNYKHIVENREFYENSMVACQKILKQSNSQYAKETERDEAIEDLTKQVDDIKQVLKRLETFIIPNNNEVN